MKKMKMFRVAVDVRGRGYADIPAKSRGELENFLDTAKPYEVEELLKAHTAYEDIEIVEVEDAGDSVEEIKE